MGEQSNSDALQDELFFVPNGEVQRVLALNMNSRQRAAMFADMCRINVLYMITRAGSGHVGSSFSCLDFVSWLYLEEIQSIQDHNVAEGDLFFSSKGHDAPALYAVLLATGRLPFDLIHKLRRLNGLPGHPDVTTPGIVTNTGSLGMGISKAKGIAFARRLKAQSGRIFVLTGDGELQEGQIWESLISAANHHLGEITAIVDHNKVQSDFAVSSTGNLGDLEAKFASFGWHVARMDGHDFARIAETLEACRDIVDRPKVIIAETCKGRGVSFMEYDSRASGDRYRFHSGAPSPEDYRNAVAELSARINRRLQEIHVGPVRLERVTASAAAFPEAPQERLVDAYSRELIAHAQRRSDIVALDADLALDMGLLPFKAAFPDRFVECGIAEMDMVSQAGGMARAGLLPMCHSFSCFLTSRSNEQIYNNASERTKIIYVGGLAGLIPGGPGHSHQSLRDIACLGCVPGLTLIEPCSEQEVASALDWSVNRTPHSTYLRLTSVPWRVPFELPTDYVLEYGKGVTLLDGRHAVIFAYGPVMLSQAWTAAMLLKERERIELSVVNLPWLNVVDRAWLTAVAARYSALFTLDNHYLNGGQGEMLCAALAEAGVATPVQRFGLADIPACGTNSEVLTAHGLDGHSLAVSMARCLQQWRRG